MRTSVTYVYHFNDSQVVSKVGSSVTGSQFADSISDYFNSFSSEKFQVYEENGEFRDPIFDDEEANIMARAKNVMTVTLLSAIVFMGIAIAVYAYLALTGDRTELRIVGMIGIGISAFAVLAADFLVSSQTIRTKLYSRFIGVPLNEQSTVNILLGSPFERTFIIFSTVLAVAIICILLYIHYNVTRERRLFS